MVGLENITELVETDDLLLIDGGTGIGDRQPVRRRRSRSTATSNAARSPAGARLHAMRDLPARTRDGIDIRLLANIDGPDELDDALEYGAMGIGLFRTEYLFMTGDALPDEEPLPERASRVLEQLERHAGDDPHVRSRRRQARAVRRGRRPRRGRTRRSGCARSGCACRRSARDLFQAQLRGLLRASAHGRSKLMFPMISGVAELRAAKAVVDEVKAELRAEGIAFDEEVKLGIMIEMPSAALTADLLAQRVRLLLDRHERPHPVHDGGRSRERVRVVPLRAAAPVADPADRRRRDARRSAANIPVTVCGEMAGEPMIAPVLVGLGIRELSMSAVSIPEVKAAIRQMTVAETEALVERDPQPADGGRGARGRHRLRVRARRRRKKEPV